MNTKVFGILVASLILLSILVITGKTANGSVMVTGEYNATTTDSVDANKAQIIKTGSGTLGSVVVASTTVAGKTVRLFDTASTTATSSAREIVNFGPNPDNGTYTYDVVFTNGLVVDVQPGFNGNYTVTWR